MLRINLRKPNIIFLGFDCTSVRDIPVLGLRDISTDTIFFDHSIDIDLTSDPRGVLFVFNALILFLSEHLQYFKNGYRYTIVDMVNHMPTNSAALLVLKTLASFVFCTPNILNISPMALDTKPTLRFPKDDGKSDSRILNLAIREFVYFSTPDHQSARSRIVIFYVDDYRWSSIMRDIFTTPEKFPSLRCIEYNASSMDTLCDSPVYVQRLLITDPDNTCVARIQQVVRDSRMDILHFNCITEDCLLENDKISEFILGRYVGGLVSGFRFRHKFPKLRYLNAGELSADFDLSGCPKLQKVHLTLATEDVFIKLLVDVPSLSYTPFIRHWSCTPPPASVLVSKHAPHLLPTIKHSFSWTPRLHGAFDYLAELFGTFLCACDFLVSTSAIPAFDPAVLECVLRHAVHR
jgi:hypothetical protein